MQRHGPHFSFTPLLLSILLMVAILAVFCQVTSHDFLHFDDNIYVTQNAHLKAGLNPKSLAWAFTTTHGGLWHPITWLSLMLDYSLYELDAWGYHFNNLLLHIASTVLLFLLFNKITGEKWKSGFVAAMFALHPLHVESVAWVAQRKDVLATFFWMLTTWSYAHYVDRPGVKRYTAVVLCFCLGLMAKPMIVTLPFVLILLDYWPLGRLQTERTINTVHPQRLGGQSTRLFALILEKTPLFVLSAAVSIVTSLAMGQLIGSEVFPTSLSLTDRVAKALVAYPFYIGKMLWPHNLAAFYPSPGVFPVWQIAGAAVLLTGISVWAVVNMRTRSYLLVGWLWFLVTLVPVSGLVGFGLPWLAADRYSYVSLIGLFIMIAWGVADVSACWRFQRVILTGLAGVVIPILMVCSWFQVKTWRSTASLFGHALAVTEDNWLARKSMADTLVRQGRVEEAILQYRQAIGIKPDYVEANYNLGNTLFSQGRIDEAITHYGKALEIKSDYVRAHYNLGLALYMQQRIDSAISHYREAIRIKPDFVNARVALGLALCGQGKVDEAVSHYTEALRTDPAYVEARNNLGLALVRQGKIDEAISQYREALRLKPDYAKAHVNLGIALVRQHRIDEAISHYHEALRLHPGFGQAHYFLALAYSRIARQDLALKQYQSLAVINPGLAAQLLEEINRKEGQKTN